MILFQNSGRTSITRQRTSFIKGTKEGENDSLLKSRHSAQSDREIYSNASIDQEFELESYTINLGIPRDIRLRRMLERYKYHRKWFLFLLIVQLVADIGLGYYTYFKINSFGSYLIKIAEMEHLTSVFSFVRTMVIIDSSIQCIFFYLLGFLAVGKTEVRKYKKFEVGIIFCVITKFVLSYIVLFYLLCLMMRLLMYSYSKFLKNLIMNIVYAIRLQESNISENL